MDDKRTLVADGYKLVVHMPIEMAEALKRLAFERSVGQKGMLSLAATVRVLLQEKIDEEGGGNRKNRGKPRQNQGCLSDVARQVSRPSPSSSPSALRNAA